MKGPKFMVGERAVFHGCESTEMAHINGQVTTITAVLDADTPGYDWEGEYGYETTHFPGQWVRECKLRPLPGREPGSFEALKDIWQPQRDEVTA